MDIDSISDITGISMSKIDFAEQGSLHSESFGSDNTDALLNASFKDLEGDESLLGSISEVGASEIPHKSPKESHRRGQQEHYKASNGSDEFFVHNGTHDTYVHPGLPEVSYVHKRIPDTFMTGHNKDGNHEIRDTNAIKHVQNFEQNRNSDGGNFKGGSLGNVIYKENLLPKEFSSDSEISLSGRESVIKHHSSLNPESLEKAIKHDQKQTHHISETKQTNTGQYQVNSRPGMISPTDTKLQIKPVGGNELFPWGQSGFLGDSNVHMKDMVDHHGMIKEHLTITDSQNDSGPRQGNIADVYGYEGTKRDVNNESREDYLRTNFKEFRGGHWEADAISRISRGVSNRDDCYESSESEIRAAKEMPRDQDHLQDSSDEKGQAEEMLLGVKHDPQTNGN